MAFMRLIASRRRGGLLELEVGGGFAHAALQVLRAAWKLEPTKGLASSLTPAGISTRWRAAALERQLRGLGHEPVPEPPDGHPRPRWDE